MCKSSGHRTDDERPVPDALGPPRSLGQKEHRRARAGESRALVGAMMGRMATEDLMR